MPKFGRTSRIARARDGATVAAATEEAQVDGAAAANAPLGTVVVTRFSIRWKGKVPDVNWVDARFDLLQRTAYPSLTRQAVDGLLWVVLTAREHRSYVASLFEQLSLPRGNIVITRTGEAVAVSDFFPDADRFLTARLDSDDAFMPSALPAAIERCTALGDQMPLIVNFSSGYQLDWETGRMYRLTFPATRQGPFLALTNVGRSALLDEVGRAHDRARSGRQVVDVDGPQWIQVIHGDNIINRIPNVATKAAVPAREAQAALSAAGVRR